MALFLCPICNVSPIPYVIYSRMDKKCIQLIEGCRRRERKAQQTLYKEYAPWLYRVCLRFLSNPAEAEEAMQDSVMKILTHLDEYKETASFEGWMQRITIHTAIDYLRKQDEEWDELPENFQVADEDTTEEEENIQYSVEKIKVAMTKLALGFRVVLSLYLFEGYDMEEIASILHLQQASVRSQYLRGKKKLIEQLKKTTYHE